MQDTGFKIPYLLHNIMYGAILFKILNLLTFCEPLSTALTFTLLLSEILHTSDGQKRDKKNTSLECLGHKQGRKLIFWTLLIIIVKSFYLIAIQYVSLRLLFKIINLYKIYQHIDYQCIN